MTDSIRHGYCTSCESRLGVARVDGVEHLVCHCTGVDAEYGPQPLDGTGMSPPSWEWRENGDASNGVNDADDSTDSDSDHPHDPSAIGWALIYLVIGVTWVYVRLKDLVERIREVLGR